ncbi:MAG: hypothetical protein J6K92_13195 [Oscillospiraceae bacterium]|nr:hypothetical protein [Oscillospiraceae bacterium]
MITKEQIESTFRREEEFDRRCGVFAGIICRLLKIKAMPAVLAFILILSLIYIISAGNLAAIFLRTGRVLLIAAGIVIFVFAGIMINILAVNILEHRKLLPSVKHIYPLIRSLRLKKELEKEPAKAEKKLIDRIVGKGVKPDMLFDLAVYFNYCLGEKPEGCRYIYEQAVRLRDIDDHSDRLITHMEYSLAISEKNAAETVRIFEENEKIFSEGAFDTAENLLAYLNNLGEYYFAKGRYDTALEMFLEKKECTRRYTELRPDRKSVYADNLALDEQDIAKCFEKLDMPEEAQKHIRAAEKTAAYEKRGVT